MFQAIACDTQTSKQLDARPMRSHWTLTTSETILFVAAVLLMAGGFVLIVGH
jgi:hypothetical protein